MADGHLNVCMECVRKRAQDYYDRRMQDPLFVERERQRHREKQRRARLDPDKLFKDKVRQRTAAHVRQGRIKKRPCEVCGCEKVEAHHDDYENHIQVRWLCKKHHMAHHAQAGDLRKLK